jgi:hypothetical protein
MGDLGMSWRQCRPLGLYFDAVSYTKRDAFEGVYLTDFRTDRRSLVCIIRSRLMPRSQ